MRLLAGRDEREPVIHVYSRFVSGDKEGRNPAQ